MKPHRKALARVIRELAEDIDSGVNVAEVGVAAGKTSRYLLEKVPEIDDLWLIDRWRPPEPDEPYAKSGSLHARKTLAGHRGNLESVLNLQDEHPGRCFVVRGSSRQVGYYFDAGTLDVVILDASHEYQDVYDDLHRWYPLAESLVCVHNWNPDKKESGPYRAVDLFLSTLGGMLKQPRQSLHPGHLLVMDKR